MSEYCLVCLTRNDNVLFPLFVSLVCGVLGAGAVYACVREYLYCILLFTLFSLVCVFFACR